MNDAPNPFLPGASGVVNLTKVSAAIRANREEAKRLARAAGADLGKWFPEHGPAKPSADTRRLGRFHGVQRGR
jgi:hypothetical protein